MSKIALVGVGLHKLDETEAAGVPDFLDRLVAIAKEEGLMDLFAWRYLFHQLDRMIANGRVDDGIVDEVFRRVIDEVGAIR